MKKKLTYKQKVDHAYSDMLSAASSITVHDALALMECNYCNDIKEVKTDSGSWTCPECY